MEFSLKTVNSFKALKFNVFFHAVEKIILLGHELCLRSRNYAAISIFGIKLHKSFKVFKRSLNFYKLDKSWKVS